MTTEKIIHIFTNEFQALKPKDKCFIFKMKYQTLKGKYKLAQDTESMEIWDFEHNKWSPMNNIEFIESFIWKPGNYLFWRNGEVIRVGRALDNARKRALVYLNDTPKIKEVYDYIQLDLENTYLILFSFKEERDRHWAAALEIYFDEHEEIKPVKRSKKLG
jgi:hypothetical protein